MTSFDQLRTEYNDILEQLNGNLDQRERAKLQRRLSQLQEILTLHDRLTESRQALADAQELRDAEGDPELAAMCEEEIAQLSGVIEVDEQELDDLLYPADEHDVRNVYLEIRAGAGGQEAALFAYNLFEMYQLYAAKQGWNLSIIEANSTDIGGYKELVVFVKGKNAYKHLKFESGVHRVQRVPATETQGRVHTSTVTVAVLPEADEVDVDINPNDLRIDTYRAGGAGGQHVNKTDSAVRITHIPTGTVVQCQDERSQIKNKNKAMKVLQARILESEKSKKAAAESKERKQQVGSGDRSEKIRTYNYPQNRITDHRINLTLKKLDYVMRGEFDEVVTALLDYERRARRS
ncbi:MAG: peptide chain release factor 1 [Candidatus Dependentiae bacterium]|jgi:peptide chain release factor 1